MDKLSGNCTPANIASRDAGQTPYHGPRDDLSESDTLELELTWPDSPSSGARLSLSDSHASNDDCQLGRSDAYPYQAQLREPRLLHVAKFGRHLTSDDAVQTRPRTGHTLRRGSGHEVASFHDENERLARERRVLETRLEHLQRPPLAPDLAHVGILQMLQHFNLPQPEARQAQVDAVIEQLEQNEVTTARVHEEIRKVNAKGLSSFARGLD